ncbi:MAG: MarR family transcriptional regulator [Clostridia bacterium]|nr:MarR family transcriptional regulator [Clostridia bacterium]
MATDKKLTDKALDHVSEDELLKLDNQLCFSLYVCSKEVIKRYKPLLEPYGLTYTGYITMMALWEKDNVNVKELGSRLFLDSGTLTPLLKKLEAQGYVERTRDPRDERNIIIRLTDKGRDLKNMAVCVPRQMLEGLEIGNMKAVVLMKTLHQLMDAFQEDNENA